MSTSSRHKMRARQSEPTLEGDSSRFDPLNADAYQDELEANDAPLEPARDAPPSKAINLNAPAVLVLNASFEPLHVCSIKRAVTLIMHEIAERVDDSAALLHSPSTSIKVPSVIRLRRYIKRPPRFHIAFNRRNVFRRDNHTCQYCGHVGGDLTLDHVIPRSKGGKNSWENIVAACRECNSRKRDRTPFEARMKLLREPYAPRFVFSTAYGQAPKFDPNWDKYLG
jgi:5-methylcytosine-specific restriction endonuclease McrA